MAVVCWGADSQVLATILDPFDAMFVYFGAKGTICDLNIVTLPQLRCLRLEHGDIATVEMSET